MPDSSKAAEGEAKMTGGEQSPIDKLFRDSAAFFETDFEVLEERCDYNGRVVNSSTVTVKAPNGQEIERQVVRHPGAVGVVAVHNNQLVLVRQYRAAIDAAIMEVPAGKLDVSGESLETAANRELIEEVGYSAASMRYLGMFVPTVGFSDEMIAVFWAEGLSEVAAANDGVEEEFAEVLHIPVDEIKEHIQSRSIVDPKTLLGLYWARDAGLVNF